MADIYSEQFQSEDKAREYLENIRWANGVYCPHCGSVAKHYELKGKSTRPGLYKCKDCRKQFTVTVGTLFERSKIKLHKWLMATYLLCSSKKGISTHQLHRTLGVTYKTAWFMTHRIREAMKDPVFANKLGSNGGTVEVDETFWGNSQRNKGKIGGGWAHKEKIFSLVERGGEVRSFHVTRVNSTTLQPIMKEQIAQESHVMTDEFNSYKGIDRYFENHDTVCHRSGEYARGPIHSNTVENYFSILKMGLVGVYQHVGSNHLKRYIGEFDFRYSNRKRTDLERTDIALKGITGKRLMYRTVANS